MEPLVRRAEALLRRNRSGWGPRRPWQRGRVVTNLAIMAMRVRRVQVRHQPLPHVCLSAVALDLDQAFPYGGFSGT